MKKIIVMAGLLFFLVSIVLFAPCRSYAINPQPEPPKTKPDIVTNETCTGTIIKIIGTKITVRDDKGKERIIESNRPGLKIGDKVKVTTRNGLTWLNPQPEPPVPAQMKQIKN